MAKNGRDLISGGIMQTGIASTVHDPQGVSINLVLNGRPLVLVIGHDGHAHMKRLDVEDGNGPVVSMPLTNFGDFYDAGRDRRIIPAGAPH